MESPDLKSEELTRTEQLMYESKFEEALKIIKNYEKEKVETSEDKLSMLILKGRIYNYRSLYLEAIEVGDLAYRMSQKIGKVSESIDALLIKSHIIFLGKLEKALNYIVVTEKLFNSINGETTSEFSRLQADLLFLKSIICYFKLEHSEALELALQCLELREKIGKKLDISQIYWQLGQTYIMNSKPQLALNYAMKSLRLQEELGNKVGIATCLGSVSRIYYSRGDFNKALEFGKLSLSIKQISQRAKMDTLQTLAAIHREKGELDRALRHYKRAIELAKDLDYKDELILNLLGIGATYRMKGDYDLAAENLKLSLSLSKESKLQYGIIPSLFYLILISLEKESRKQAQQYLENLKEFSDQTESKMYTQAYQIAKALVLKSSGRIRNRSESELLLKQIAEVDGVAPQLHLLSLVNLCDLFLEELHMTNNLDILDEITPLINKMLKIAENRSSYLWLAETKLLEGKLALIQMDVDKVKQLFTQAQNVAELNGLNLLAIKISSEYDKLLEQINVWDNLKERNAPLSERIKLASIDGVIERIQGRRAVDPPKLTREVPVLLLIISEGGNPLFSNSFAEEWTFEDDLISGFLSAFNTFSAELFSKGLDRAKFGEYNILMQPVGTFSVCYLFKGQTYLAKQKLSQFTERIQKTPSIWQILNEFYQTNQMVNIKDAPLLETAITEIFTQ